MKCIMDVEVTGSLVGIPLSHCLSGLNYMYGLGWVFLIGRAGQAPLGGLLNKSLFILLNYQIVFYSPLNKMRVSLNLLKSSVNKQVPQ